MTSIDNFNKHLYNFIDTEITASIDELFAISEAIWDMLGETPEQFAFEQEIQFS